MYYPHRSVKQISIHGIVKTENRTTYGEVQQDNRTRQISRSPGYQLSFISPSEDFRNRYLISNGNDSNVQNILQNIITCSRSIFGRLSSINGSPYIVPEYAAYSRSWRTTISRKNHITIHGTAGNSV